MKQSKLALTAVIVVAIGLTGFNLIDSSISQPSEDIEAMGEIGLFMGHITLVHKDPQGNILSYIQTDNIVSNEGKDCSLELIFGASGSCTAASATDKFDTIGLTNGQSFPHNTNATGSNGLNTGTNDLQGNGLDPAVGAIQNDVAAIGTGYGASSTGGKIDVFKQFTAAIDTLNVDGAILYNTAKDMLFAAQTFSPVVLNTDDTLDVTWTITLGTT